MPNESVPTERSLHADGSLILAALPDRSRPVAWLDEVCLLAGELLWERIIGAIDDAPSLQFVIAPVAAFDEPESLRAIEWRVAAGRRLHLLLLVGPNELDLVGASLGYPWVGYICGAADSDEVAQLVRGWRGAPRLVVSDEMPTLLELGEEAARIAHSLSRLAARLPRAVVQPGERPVDATWIRRGIRLRRLRERFFPPELFADPAWDILLDLAAARLEGVATPVSSLCVAAAVPATTALRWIKGMTEGGFLVREPDPFDKRRILVRLSDATFEQMIACLTAMRAEGMPV